LLSSLCTAACTLECARLYCLLPGWILRTKAFGTGTKKSVFMRYFASNCQIEANIWFAIQLYYIEKCNLYGLLQGLVGGDTHRKRLVDNL